MKIYLIIMVVLFSMGCSQKNNIDRSRSYFSKDDNRVDRKRMLKNIDNEIKGIVNYDEAFREKKEEKRLSNSDLDEIEASVRRELGYE